MCIEQGVPAAFIDSFINPTVSVATVSSGNTELQPEIGKTKTVGAVWEPDFGSALFQEFSLSVDFWEIKIEEVINTLSGVTVLNSCFNLDGSNPSFSLDNEFCQLIDRRDSGAVDTIRTTFLNLGGIKTRGVDISIHWNFDIAETFGLGVRDAGEFSFDANVTRLNTFVEKNLPGEPFREFAGTIECCGTRGPLTGVHPRWSVLATPTYSFGPAELTLRWQYLSSMDDRTSVTRPGSPSPGVSDYNVFDLVGRWNVLDNLGLRAGVINLTDKKPPIVGGTPGDTNPGTFDVIGSRFFLGATVDF